MKTILKEGKYAAKGKQVYLEVLRIMAIILVIFNHTGNNGFFLFSVSGKSIWTPVYLFCSIACKIAVPLFWMISGSLLLGKEEPIKTVYRKRVLRMVIVLAVFSFIQYLYNLLFLGQSDIGGIVYFLNRLYTNKWATAYWYIYAYIGILIVLPVLRKLIANMEEKDYKYLFTISILANGAIPIVQYLAGKGQWTLNSRVFENLLSMNVVYFIAGYYFGKVIKKESMTIKKALIFLFVGGIAIAISCFMTKFQIAQTGSALEKDAQMFHNSLSIFPTCAVFYTMRFWFDHIRISNRMTKILSALGGATFGVMLIENIMRNQLKPMFESLKVHIHIFPACMVWVLCAWGAGTIITFIMKQIPGLKKII